MVKPRIACKQASVLKRYKKKRCFQGKKSTPNCVLSAVIVPEDTSSAVNDDIHFVIPQTPSSINDITQTLSSSTNDNTFIAESSSSAAVSNVCENTPAPSKVYNALRNMSAEKILNNKDFHVSSDHVGVKTRATNIKLGFVSKKCGKSVVANGNKIVNMSISNDSVADSFMCKTCRSPRAKVSIMEYPESKCGLAEKLIISCSNCKASNPFFTSSRINATTAKKVFQINARSVHASLSVGQAGLAQFCAGMDLPAPVSSNSYNKILKLLSSQSVDKAEALMVKACNRLLDLTLEEDPDNVDVLPDGKMVAGVSVSVDGTWQRRGHCSKIGVVFVISVRTGEVLDYVVKSLFCHLCSKKASCLGGKSSVEFLKWFDSHQEACLINHQGSSDSMEADGTSEIFLRSIERGNLKYTTFVGDGDTGSFGKVRKSCQEVYGDRYLVVKEECVGHIQKRMGTGLRELKRKKKGIKLADGKTIGGRNRLTDKIADKMQNNYGEAIRNNPENIVAMERAIWAIYNRMIKHDTDSNEIQHQFCPKGPESWCTFWRNPAEYSDSKRLPSCFREVLLPLFTNLTKPELLSRCLKGLTQNQNEAINGMLWRRCPKTKFCGKVKVEMAVSETVCEFNAGALSKATIINSLGIESTENQLTALRKVDSKRMDIAAKKILEIARKRRRKLRASKKSKKDDVVKYQAGSFGLSCEPEDITVNKPKKLKRKLTTTSNVTTTTLSIDAVPMCKIITPPITFVDECTIGILIIINILGDIN